MHVKEHAVGSKLTLTPRDDYNSYDELSLIKLAEHAQTPFSTQLSKTPHSLARLFSQATQEEAADQMLGTCASLVSPRTNALLEHV